MCLAEKCYSRLREGFRVILLKLTWGPGKKNKEGYQNGDFHGFFNKQGCGDIKRGGGKPFAVDSRQVPAVLRGKESGASPGKPSKDIRF